jgi:hypothetical protein
VLHEAEHEGVEDLIVRQPGHLKVARPFAHARAKPRSPARLVCAEGRVRASRLLAERFVVETFGGPACVHALQDYPPPSWPAELGNVA